MLKGGTSGFTPSPSYTTPNPNSVRSLILSGDINGDGYADVSGITVSGTTGPAQLWQFFGGPKGLVPSPNGPITLPVGADSDSTVQGVLANESNGDLLC